MINQRVKLVGIVVLIVIGVVIVISLIINSLFGDLLVVVSQPDTILQIEGQPTTTIASSQVFRLRFGKYKILAKKDGYEDYSGEFSIGFGSDNKITTNLTPKNQSYVASPANINFDQQLRSQIDPNKYTITKVGYMENNSWAVVFMKLNIPQTQGLVSVLKFNYETGKWDTIVEPNEVISTSVKNEVPGSVYEYLAANKKLIGGNR